MLALRWLLPRCLDKLVFAIVLALIFQVCCVARCCWLRVEDTHHFFTRMRDQTSKPPCSSPYPSSTSSSSPSPCFPPSASSQPSSKVRVTCAQRHHQQPHQQSVACFTGSVKTGFTARPPTLSTASLKKQHSSSSTPASFPSSSFTWCSCRARSWSFGSPTCSSTLPAPPWPTWSPPCAATKPRQRFGCPVPRGSCSSSRGGSSPSSSSPTGSGTIVCQCAR